ncbi:MAG TPA: HlyD family efflux transporter periplasmic adaptor subunit, partial [Acidimicrobiales bacterium]|nr:HlyD family efflux transporter periplasmic adaptor subunit [Acidimicrobiales bacterium]
DPVVAGEPIALITPSNGTPVTVRAPVTGEVVEVAVSQQEYVSPGTQMAVIRPHDDTLVVHAYIPTGLAHDIPIGSEAEVSPSTVAPSAYGFLKGRVQSVAPFPATQQRLQEVLQNQSLVKQVSSSGPVTEVLVDLETARTPSGYAWSIGQGPSYAALTGGLPAEVTIVVGTRHPISYVI